VITLSDNTTLTLTVAPDATVTKYTTEAITDIKSGDRILAFGEANDDGTYSATAIGVNMRLGFGGGRGGRGFGGGGGGGGAAGGGGGG
jgi:hypothetical protein